MTLVELSLTLALLLAFASVVAFSLGGLTKWKLGRRASVDLQSVYLAQKSYLSDHPTVSIAAVSAADLQQYLPSTMTSIPTVEALDGSSLTIDINEMPPIVTGGYDPSGYPEDGLWDVGTP